VCLLTRLFSVAKRSCSCVPFGAMQHICVIHAHIFPSRRGQLPGSFLFPPSLVLWQLVVLLFICMHLKINLLLFYPGHQVSGCEFKLYNCTFFFFFFSFSISASPLFLAIKTFVVCIKIVCVIVADFLRTENSLVRGI